MRFTHFEVRNFKGIQKVRLNLTAAPRSLVHTLIGLNESGKTTILEAINRFEFRDSLDALDLPGYGQYDPHDLIPISKRSNFNGKIEIEAGVELDDADQKLVAGELRKAHGLVSVEQILPFKITQSFQFKASRLEAGQPTNTWTVKFIGTPYKRRKAITLPREPWLKMVEFLKPLLPRVVYFPNFLFEFPDKIYLESAPADEDKHEFYRSVLQDVLDALGEGTNLAEHVLARAKAGEDFAKKSLDSVLLKMGGHITATVFTNWNKIFRRPRGDKEKEIVVSIEKDARNAWYVQLRLKENNEYYEISERSLGFRWFFTYLLLTQYRGFRNAAHKSIVFLLDEPASNLHSSAQAQLLDSFGSLPTGCAIVYTTHSHHLIRPEWLEGAYVVKNAGLDYQRSDDDATARSTVVTLHRYREFAAQHPNQTTYFQPVLDLLDYRPSDLENVPDVVMLEGKTDFYTMQLLKGSVVGAPHLNFLPGGGSGSLDSAIQLYVAWGRNFIVVLDSDSEGVTQKHRYQDRFGPLVQNRIFTLGDLDANWTGKSIEALFENGDALSVQKHAYAGESTFNKTHFHRSIQELIATKIAPSLCPATIANFSRLFEAIRNRLNDVAGT